MPITKKHYLTGALALPFVLPPLNLVVIGTSSSLVAFLFASMLAGGVPYLFFAALLAWRLRRASDAEIEEAAVRAPVRFIPYQLASVALALAASLALGYAPADTPGTGMLMAFLFVIPAVLIFGYVCVTITFILMALLQAMGLVERDADPPAFPPPAGTLPGRP